MYRPDMTFVLDRPLHVNDQRVLIKLPLVDENNGIEWSFFMCGLRAAFRIHLSQVCKEVLDVLGGYVVEYRGETELKVGTPSSSHLPFGILEAIMIIIIGPFTPQPWPGLRSARLGSVRLGSSGSAGLGSVRAGAFSQICYLEWRENFLLQS